MGRGSPCQPHLELKCEHLKLCFSWTAAALSVLRELFTEALKKKKFLPRLWAMPGLCRGSSWCEQRRGEGFSRRPASRHLHELLSSSASVQGRGKKTTHTHTCSFLQSPLESRPFAVCPGSSQRSMGCSVPQRSESRRAQGSDLQTFRELFFSRALSNSQINTLLLRSKSHRSLLSFW